jgi:hypothetical protein
LATGEWLEIDGSPEDVARRLEDASRSSSGTHAWLKEVDRGETVAISSSHVVMLRPGAA